MLVPLPIEYTATLVNAPAATAEATASAATAERIIPNILIPLYPTTVSMLTQTHNPKIAPNPYASPFMLLPPLFSTDK